MSLLLASLAAALAPLLQDPHPGEAAPAQDDAPAPQGDAPAPQGDTVPPQGDDAPPDPSVGTQAALARLAAELEEALASRYRMQADAYGIAGGSQPLAADSAWWIRFLQHQQNSFNNLWTAALDERERSLRNALVDRCRAESILIATLPRARWDPVYYVESARFELELARRSSGDARALGLASVGRVLEQAGPQIVSPRSDWIEEALLRLGGLRLELAALGGEPGSEAALAGWQSFADWLRDSDARRGETVPHLGRRNWEALVAASSGNRRTTDELRKRLLREVARLDNEIGTAAPRPMPAGAPIEPMLDLAASCAAFASERVSAAELLPPPAIELELVARPGSPYPERAARVEHAPGRSRLVVATPHALWPAPLRATYERDLNPWTLGAWAIRWTLPGEGHLVGIARGEPGASPLSWSRSTVEGWGLYALDWLLRHPGTAPAFRSEQAELCREMLRVRRFETALLLAALEWHALERPAGMVAEDLARRADLDVSRAEIEVRRVTHDPLLGIGALGALELADLERRIAAEAPGTDAVRSVLSLLMRQPALRPQDLLQGDLVGRRSG